MHLLDARQHQPPHPLAEARLLAQDFRGRSNQVPPHWAYASTNTPPHTSAHIHTHPHSPSGTHPLSHTPPCVHIASHKCICRDSLVCDPIFRFICASSSHSVVSSDARIRRARSHPATFLHACQHPPRLDFHLLPPQILEETPAAPPQLPTIHTQTQTQTLMPTL